MIIDTGAVSDPQAKVSGLNTRAFDRPAPLRGLTGKSIGVSVENAVGSCTYCMYGLKLPIRLLIYPLLICNYLIPLLFKTRLG